MTIYEPQSNWNKTKLLLPNLRSGRRHAGFQGYVCAGPASCRPLQEVLMGWGCCRDPLPLCKRWSLQVFQTSQAWLVDELPDSLWGVEVLLPNPPCSAPLLQAARRELQKVHVGSSQAGGRQRYFARQRPDRGPDAAGSLSSVQKFAVLAPDFPPAANILNQGCMARASTLVRPLLGWALLAWGCSWCPLGFDANAAFKTPLFQCKHWRWQMLSLICKKRSWCYVKTYARESILKMVQGPVSYES